MAEFEEILAHLPKAYYQDDAVAIFCADCRDFLPLIPDKSIDLVLTDPPYGMNNNPDNTRFSGGKHKRGIGTIYSPIVGDNKPFDPTPWLNFPAVILWGSNHFANLLPLGTTLIWIKKYSHLYGSFLSDAEIAWQQGGCGVYCFEKSWTGFNRNPLGKSSQHPNQKPISLMEWCIGRSGIGKDTIILEPYMGSGTTLLAAKKLGRKCIGIEIEERYCEIAARRLSQTVMRLDIG